MTVEKQATFTAVGGYLLRAVEGEERYRIVNYKNARGKMSAKDKEKFDAVDFVDLDACLLDEKDLFDCSSKMLFQMVPTQKKLFFEQKDTRKSKVVTTRTCVELKRQSRSEMVIPIVYRNNQKKYVRYSDDRGEYTVFPTESLPSGTLETTNDVAHTLFDIDGIRFTQADCDVLKLYSANKRFYNTLGVNLLMRCNKEARTYGNRSVKVTSRFRRSHKGKASVIQNYHDGTFRDYGKKLGVLLFMLVHISELSFFSAYHRSADPAASGKGFTEINSSELLESYDQRPKEEIDVTCWSKLCIDMLKEKDTLGEVLDMLVRCCALSFERIDFMEERPAKTTREIRKTLDALKAFLINASMCTAGAEGHELFDDEDCCRRWRWLKGVYHETCEEEAAIDRKSISLVPECQGALVSGKLFNRQYIRDFHGNCVSRIAELIGELNEDFEMPSVSYVAARFLRNRNHSFREVKKSNTRYKQNVSLLDLLTDSQRRELLPRIRRTRTDSIDKKVTGAVDEIARLLMWMVYFGVGYPYRFPELRQMAFSGPERNVYVEDQTRRIQFWCWYNKNKKLSPILKTVDGVSSEHLFYFIFVLREMQLNALHGSDKHICVTVNSESVTLMKDYAPAERTRSALRTYLFLDCERGDLVDYTQFEKYLRKYPAGDRERLTFQELRQGLNTLTKSYVKHMESSHLATQHRRDGYSVGTTYAEDVYSSESVAGHLDIMEQEASSVRYIEWSQLEENLAVLEESSAVSATEKPSRYREYAVEPKCHEDLIVAGRKSYGPAFEFRDMSQERVCNELYLSGYPSMAVQAPAGYGKTELFRLPLVALASKKSCKHVSFVFVPFALLVAGTLQRLSANKLLKGNDVKTFIASGYDGVTDVYVGDYEDLAKEEFAGRIIGWESANGREVKLSYLVIREFHAFETENFSHSQLGKIGEVRFDAFEKVLFLSATAPAEIANAALQRIGFKGLELGERGEAVAEDHSRGMPSYRTKFFDLVTELPLQHVRKNVIRTNDVAGETFKLLKDLFTSDSHARAIVAVSNRSKVEELARVWESDFRIHWLHSTIPQNDRVERAQRFMGDGSSQVLLGTKLVTEGINVPNLMLVIMMDCGPNIVEFIKAAGQLRSSGAIYLLSSGKTWSGDGLLPPVEYEDLDGQIAAFYGLDLHAVVRPQEVTSQQTVAEHLVMESTSSAPKRAAEDESSVDRKRQKLEAEFHGSYKSIITFLRLPDCMSSCLELRGVDHLFCPPRTFANTGVCEDCQEECNECMYVGERKTYLQIACQVLAVRRMLLDDRDYEKHLKLVEECWKEPMAYLVQFLREKEKLRADIISQYSWFQPLVSGTPLVFVQRLLKGQSRILLTRTGSVQAYRKVWQSLKDRRLNVLEYFYDEEIVRCDGIWEREPWRGGPSHSAVVGKQGTFDRLVKKTSARFQTRMYIKEQYVQVHAALRQRYERYNLNATDNVLPWDMYLSMALGTFYNRNLRSRLQQLLEGLGDVRLIPHWLELQNAVVKTADGKTVPFYVVCAVVHDEMLQEGIRPIVVDLT